MASVVKDDVDRLFECFKCGISPPQSAMVSRKRRKSKLKQGSSEHEVSGHADNPSPTSTGKSKLNETNKQLILENHISTSKGKDNNREKYFSPVIFYGSPHGVPPKRPSSLLRLLHEIRIDLAANNELKLRREVWATFPRQEEAIKFVARQYTHVRIFSYQNHYNGQRRFLVAAYEEFWRRYKSMDSLYRHHYEVIQEGLPCHLYFDLEYCKRVNTEKKGDDMVDLLISVIFEALHEKYSILGNRDWIIELDSSTEEKFSRHLIMRIPKTAFKDNSHVGAFVVEICSRIRGSKDGRFHGLFVKKDASSIESSSQLFVDTAVYTRNRCFRLALSSKAGRTSQLLPTNRFSCKDMREKDMFMASLICNIDVDCEKLLVCKMELECAKTLHFETEVNQNFGRYCSIAEESFNHSLTNVSTSYLVGKSPIPAVDNYVEFVASIGNVPGKIRSWYWFSEYGLMVYSMSRNRYCERIGREHKSNHVIYVVDLRREVYYQKCHDPDCKGYRSPLRPVPLGIISVPWSLADSIEVVKDRELTHNAISSLSLDDEHMYLQLSNEERISEGIGEDSWWLDAMRIADSIERRRNVKNFNLEDNDSLDAVEKCINHLNNPASTALQTQVISG